MPAVLLNENVTEPQEVDEEDASTHAAAYLVLIGHDGSIKFEPNINVPIIPARQITATEIKNSAQAIADDIKAQEIAATIINMQMQMARQVQEQAQNQQILQQMGKMPR